MWRKFRWDMFVTSFIPLWFSIIVVDIWDLIKQSVEVWNIDKTFYSNISSCFETSMLQVISVVVIVIIVLISIRGINSFLSDCKFSGNNPKGKIIKARKANKLSSEFLLAYILPMIAFDFSNLQKIVLFIIYFVVLAILCIRNNNIYTNILLEFKGYKMYTCDIECDVMNRKHIYCDSLIISEDDLTLCEDNEISYWDFDNYIYIQINKEG
ncbi:hypothetical protein [Clostridium frigidicarnis]|uniref:Uncharacterized protein n=1 Tax=Clostridium frigidicarnis TaxID=84698 RepID=A0A1I0Y7Y3_9CLOT|nr:hypothetical protein [Clostridium frigidicarnis]SFB08263.1 hypothetical protein SAMN04488528_101136 [Clostridium frigidicarnis]